MIRVLCSELCGTHVDFGALNASPVRFVITAVDVETGVLTRFSNKDIDGTTRSTIAPEHILASGSLAPQFPWTEIKDGATPGRYWDSGIVDNTPLGDAIDGFSAEPGVTRILVVMNLFPAEAKLPRSLAEVNDRITQLRFGNRLHQDTKVAETINKLIATIEALRGQITTPLPHGIEEQVAYAETFKRVQTFEITLAGTNYSEDEYGFRDFSRDGIEKRRKAGYALTMAKLGQVIQ